MLYRYQKKKLHIDEYIGEKPFICIIELEVEHNLAGVTIFLPIA